MEPTLSIQTMYGKAHRFVVSFKNNYPDRWNKVMAVVLIHASLSANKAEIEVNLIKELAEQVKRKLIASEHGFFIMDSMVTHQIECLVSEYETQYNHIVTKDTIHDNKETFDNIITSY